MKRGLSPVVATVLLIALVLILAIIIYLWASRFVVEQIEKFGQPIQDSCEDVSFDAELIDTTFGKELEVVNRGNIPINSFQIKQISGGNSEVSDFGFSLGVGESVREQVALDSGTEKIIIYPALLGSVKGKSSNKIFSCINEGKTIVLS